MRMPVDEPPRTSLFDAGGVLHQIERAEAALAGRSEFEAVEARSILDDIRQEVARLAGRLAPDPVVAGRICRRLAALLALAALAVSAGTAAGWPEVIEAISILLTTFGCER
jgi:hypothetical protein